MRALVLCDDYWHPARTARAGLAPLAAAGLTFDSDAAETVSIRAWCGRRGDAWPRRWELG